VPGNAVFVGGGDMGGVEGVDEVGVDGGSTSG